MGTSEIEQQILQDIDSFCKQKNEHRKHLGASILGDECARKLWYTFRWYKKENHDGRMQRLFERGKLEEERFIGYLVGIGAKVFPVNPETGKQYQISFASGHAGGSCDAICILPEKYGFGDEKFICEFKTNKTGSSFDNVAKNGVQKEKPEHFAQMSIYGYKMQIKKGLYLITNKNDDSIIVKIVDLDWELAKDLERKAVDIIANPNPPNRAYERSFFKCKFCCFEKICHYNDTQSIEKNCRSCSESVAHTDGNWYCSKYKKDIPEEAVKNGCSSWSKI
jgi:hypothetical protein